MGGVVTIGSVVAHSVCFLVVCRASVLLVGVLGVWTVVMCWLRAVVTLRVPALVSSCGVGTLVGSAMAVDGCWA